MSALVQQLGVLFADIVDSTKLAIRDSENYHDHIRPSFLQRLKILIELHDGELMHEAGDGAMITFESADEAIKFGIRLQEWESNQSFKLRIGIHFTTEKLQKTSLATLMGGTTTTENLNIKQCFKNGHTEIALAARILSSAIPGQLLISENAHKNWTDKQKIKEWKNRRFKGFQNSHSVYEILVLKQSLGEPGVAYVPTCYRYRQGTYIKRPQLEKGIIKFCEQAKKNTSNPNVLICAGEGGIGKTRSIIELVPRIAGLFDDNVIFVDLTKVKLLSERFRRQLFLQTFWNSLKKERSDHASLSEGKTEERIKKYLEGKNHLVIIDNFEAVQCKDVCDFITELSKELYLNQFIVTSRTISHSTDWVYQKFKPLSETDSIKLIKYIRKSFKINNGNEDGTDEDFVNVATAAGNNPLFLRILARINNKSIAKIAQDLGSCNKIEEQGTETRQGSLSLSIKYSLENLKEVSSINYDSLLNCFFGLAVYQQDVRIFEIASLLNKDEATIESHLVKLYEHFLCQSKESRNDRKIETVYWHHNLVKRYCESDQSNIYINLKTNYYQKNTLENTVRYIENSTVNTNVDRNEEFFF